MLYIRLDTIFHHCNTYGNDCCACMTKLDDTNKMLYVPCGHSMCKNCAQKWPMANKCPVCRADIQNFVPAEEAIEEAPRADIQNYAPAEEQRARERQRLERETCDDEFLDSD